MQVDIHKVHVQLEIPSEERSWQWQDRLSRMIRHTLTTSLEPLLAHTTTSGEILRIDRLQIDLGSFGPEISDEALESALKQAIRASVQDLPVSRDNPDNAPGIKRFSLEEYAADALRQFFREGFYDAGPVQQSPQEAFHLLLEKDPERLIDLLRDGIVANNKATAERLLYQFRLPALLPLFNMLLDPSLVQAYARIIEGWATALTLKKESGAPPALSIASSFWIEFIQTLFRERKWEPGRFTPQVLPALWRMAQKVSGLSEMEEKAWAKERMEILRSNLPHPLQKQLEEVLKSPAQQKEKIPAEEPENQQESRGESISYLCDNAGIILLHPFLPVYFTELGLAGKQGFYDKENAHRAVYLLHFLATGNLEAGEHELLLQKYLCGIPTEEPVLPEFEWAPKHHREGERLLKEVIDHWKALGKTSPDGLREGFLQRPGKLELSPQSHHLTIERKTEDILLDKLPWTKSMVKLPWMKKILTVNW